MYTVAYLLFWAIGICHGVAIGIVLSSLIEGAAPKIVDRIGRFLERKCKAA